MNRERTNTMAKKAQRSSKPRRTKPARKKAARKAAPRHEFTRGLDGWITHTDLASANPLATKNWCMKVLGWTFRPSMPMPGGGEIHLFAYSGKGGGGIRPNNPPEIPGSIPYIHVADARVSYDLALREGAEEMLSPTRVMEGVTVAIVRAPGGVPIGFSGP